MRQARRIALLISPDIGFCRRVLQGIHAYAVTRDWVFHDAPADVRVIPHMWRWKPDGIICGLYDEDIARRLARCRVPIVNTSSTVQSWRGPLVDVDNEEVGRLAAEHLLDRALRHFGFFGGTKTGSSIGRETGYRKRLAAAGFTPSVYHAEYRPVPPLNANWNGLDRPVRDWLVRLPKPVGILASHDRPGRDLVDACHQLGLRVPDEVAILGVDDDEFECWLCKPPLSSVKNPGVQVGYEAAKLLDRMMNGPPPEQLRIGVPPTHVIARQSTEMTAVEDPDVAAALAWVRDHLAGDVSVNNLAKAIGISRRTLERRFRAVLGNSVLSEIQRMRMEKAKHLIAETDLKLSVVAEQCGISGLARLTAVFKQITGYPPSTYRRLAADGQVSHAREVTPPSAG
ncbi:MAG TPA: DNA-binding transcriptional regulator [Phycisphaerae bacterium]|nr:DNA-binding transcriptional regulator [Phycisphaerae bacterium]HRY71360.1 DNA-binding transcriptional regulator [Phycisphaerae bacterium]HSA30045.1 DNA-binding transcriptional regulator [Phycisphaerae bacterium]